MTKREIAALICRVISLTVFVGVLTTAPASLMAAVFTPDSSIVFIKFSATDKALIWLGKAVPEAFTLSVAWMLWFRAGWIAAKMVGHSEEKVTVGITGAEFYGVMVFGLGLYTLVRATPEVGELLGSLFGRSRQDLYVDLKYPALAAPRLASLALQLIVGTWLLFGSSSVIRLISFLRAGGIDEEHGKGHERIEGSAE